MDFLFSNYPPMKTGNKTFAEAFYSLLPKTSKLDIAVGYVSADSLIELQKTIELNSNIRTLNLIIGMHYFDHFTKVQYHFCQRMLLAYAWLLPLQTSSFQSRILEAQN